MTGQSALCRLESEPREEEPISQRLLSRLVCDASQSLRTSGERPGVVELFRLSYYETGSAGCDTFMSASLRAEHKVKNRMAKSAEFVVKTSTTVAEGGA